MSTASLMRVIGVLLVVLLLLLLLLLWGGLETRGLTNHLVQVQKGPKTPTIPGLMTLKRYPEVQGCISIIQIAYLGLLLH
jgi:hypothetical protein